MKTGELLYKNLPMKDYPVTTGKANTTIIDLHIALSAKIILIVTIIYYNATSAT
jgi:hypothetical protein